MLFSSITFIFIFLPATIALNLIVPERFRNVILLVASLFFYAWGEPVYVILMILSIFLNYFCGKEIFENLGENDNALSTVNMQMEEFYAKAKDADYIIYNSAIDGELQTMEQLLEKSNLLKDFKAVKNGNVWCTGKNLFQESTGLGVMIEDIHKMLNSEGDSLTELTYMHRLK